MAAVYSRSESLNALLADPAARLHAEPLGLLAADAAVAAVAAGEALALAGGPVAAARLLLHARLSGRPGAPVTTATAPAGDIADWAARHADAGDSRAADLLARLTAPRAGFAGLLPSAPGLPLLMGIVNATPDSFHPGSRRHDAAAAIAHGIALAEAGAHLVDVGGESTRPGAEPPSVDAELDRVVPVVAALAKAGISVSVDTRRAPVMRAALAAGARIVNDVSALAGDPGSPSVVANAGTAAILMHMRGEPATMQCNTRYDDVLLDVADFLAARLAAAEAAGIPRARLAVDPGIGFAKTPDGNARLMGAIGALHGLGAAIVLGASRKSSLGALSRGETVEARLPGSLTAAVVAAAQGVQVVRVHDVAETRQALAVWRRLAGFA
ncbi:MAG: dihydropteroate synthase [Alphaproteobacteria bacterium]|nr:dihydropteroate synthase [Alphaproteobacteria bacterium]